MERRAVLTLLVHGGSAVIALIVGVPALIFAFSPAGRKRRYPEWRDLGPLDQFPVGEMSEGVIRLDPESEALQAVPQGVYVWRVSPKEVIVFSRSCTDLGCPLTYDRGSACFLCPCHGGIFSQDGERMAGPPDRPLYRYDNRIREGILQIDLSSVPPMV